MITAASSLLADVLSGSFVTHSFLRRNECVTNEPQRTSAWRLSRLQPLATASTSLESSPASRSKERWLYFFVTCNSSHLLPFMLLLTLARCAVTLSALAAEGTKFCREVVNASLDCRDNIKSTCSESGFNQEES